MTCASNNTPQKQRLHYNQEAHLGFVSDVYEVCANKQCGHEADYPHRHEVQVPEQVFAAPEQRVCVLVLPPILYVYCPNVHVHEIYNMRNIKYISRTV